MAPHVVIEALVDLRAHQRVVEKRRTNAHSGGACDNELQCIFGAGDVTDTYSEQVLVAAGEGAKAALSAYEYLLPTLGR